MVKCLLAFGNVGCLRTANVNHLKPLVKEVYLRIRIFFEDYHMIDKIIDIISSKVLCLIPICT